ncbi:hypothetical protein DPMN_193307 [Dreissena polymorpha]|uniref:Uncharacterized protein n=1 Tax=Dreissena polymorpha TaxID=45954 RepID=A0A9D3Y657_DREPO|nr:hypothetical protein DPMN_193307 [Dreissena polymorpha]
MLLCFAVFRCAVSPTGDKLYIINQHQHKLLTLARDGTLLATLTDPELDTPRGLQVTPLGQVLVCGSRSLTILQVDWEGRASWPVWLQRGMECGTQGQSATAAPRPQSLWDSGTATTSWCSGWNSV